MSGSCFIGWAANQAGSSATGISYTGIAPSTSTNVGDELDWRANHVGSSVVVTSFADLELLYPASGGLHTINNATRFTSFDGLPPGNHIEIVFPGSIDTADSLAVLIVGNFAGPLISGEVVMDSIAILNVNPGGSDVEMLSPLGRPMLLDTCQFLGQGGVEIKASGPVQLSGCLFLPAAPGAIGLVLTSTGSDTLLENNVFSAPGSIDYTGITIASTATITGEMFSSPSAITTVRPGDALFMVSPLATLPGGGVRPATVSGIRLINSTVRGPGSMFAAGSLTEDDIEIVASGGQGSATDTRLLGDAFVNVAGAAINMDFALVTPGVFVVVPASNGVGDIITLQALSSHFTLDVSDINNWWLRFDGPDSNKNAGIVWAIDFLKSGAANNIVGAVYRDTGGGFALVDQSESAAKLAPTALPARAEGRAPVIMSSGDKIQIRASSDGTSAIDINRIILLQEKVG